MRLLGAVWILSLFVGGCGGRDVPHSKAPEAVAAHEAPPAFDLIERLEKSAPWTPEQMMKTMGIELRQDSEKSGPAFKAYTQPPSAASPYRSVELRMPNGVGSNEQLLIVDLAHDVGVTRKDIMNRYGLEFDTEVPPPQARDLPTFLRFKRANGYVSLGVTGEDARLVSFVISRNEK